MLNSVGLPELIATTPEEYVEIAVALANKQSYLAQLRLELRDRMRTSAFGNGKIYARDFEEACINALKAKAAEDTQYTETRVRPVLPEQELVRRTELMSTYNNPSAASRVLKYCLKLYPHNPTANILLSREHELNGDLVKARQILLDISSNLLSNEKIAVDINLCRLENKIGLYDKAAIRAEQVLNQDLHRMPLLHAQTYLAVARAFMKKDEPLVGTPFTSKGAHKISIIICSIDERKYSQVTASYSSALSGIDYEVIKIPDALSLAEGYNRGIRQSSGDILIFSHDDIEILSATFAEDLLQALERNDIVGVAGSRLANGATWWSSGEEFAQGAVVMPLASRENSFGLNIFGGLGEAIIDEVQVLDGLFLAVKRSVTDKILFDETTFDGFHLYDLDFTLAAFQAGAKLAVVPNLSILHYSIGGYDNVWYDYAERFVEKYKLSSKPEYRPINWGISVELQNTQDAPKIIKEAFSQELLKPQAIGVKYKA
jgi:GT2 family glycosyltransferase